MAVPPGETLLEVLTTRGITQRELAKRMNRPPKTISEIVKGKTAITPDTSIQLEQVFDIPAEFWNNLEANYQETKARLKNIERMKEEVNDSKQYPYGEMVKVEWLPQAKNDMEKTTNLLTFFGTTSFKNIIEKELVEGVFFRISTKKNYSKPAIVAWLRKGVINSQKINTLAFDKLRLKELLPEIRKLSLEEPSIFIPKLKEIMAQSGIAFVITPNLKNAPINGVSSWISPSKAMVQLSIRNKFADIFWFSLFHEVGHLLLHDRKQANIDIDGGKDTGKEKQKEIEADNFAQKFLIPDDLYKEFVNRAVFSKDAIFSFAKEVNIEPSIIIGRLQHDEYLPYSMFSRYRTRYEWVK